MHNDWEELIPFYVAGSLSKGEASRLESHLAKCAECSKSVEEWRSIAGAVRDQAASQMRALPPLSRGVIGVARQQAAVMDYETVSRIATRRTNTPITLIAAVFTVILFGGAVMLFVMRSLNPESAGVALAPTDTLEVVEGTPSPEPQIIVIEPTTSPMPTKGQPATPLPTDVQPATSEAPPTAEQPPTVIALNPPPQVFPTFVLPTSTPTFVPTEQLPPTTMAITGMGGGSGNAGMGGGNGNPETLSFSAEAQSSSLSLQSESCEIRAAVPSAILYADTDTLSAIVGTISADEALLAQGMSAGWYNAQLPNGTMGWLQQEMVYVTGNCSDLPILRAGNTVGGAAANAIVEPTPIPMMVESPLVTIPASNINLRSGPGTDYRLAGMAVNGESYHVEAQYTRQGRVWYRLTIPGSDPAWVSASLVQLSPGNATVPTAETIPPTPTG